MIFTHLEVHFVCEYQQRDPLELCVGQHVVCSQANGELLRRTHESMKCQRTQRLLGFLEAPLIGRVYDEYDAVALAVVFIPDCSQAFLLPRTDTDTRTSISIQPLTAVQSAEWFVYLSAQVPKDDSRALDIHACDYNDGLNKRRSCMRNALAPADGRTVKADSRRDLIERDACLLAEYALELLQQRLLRRKRAQHQLPVDQPPDRSPSLPVARTYRLSSVVQPHNQQMQLGLGEQVGPQTHEQREHGHALDFLPCALTY